MDSPPLSATYMRFVVSVGNRFSSAGSSGDRIHSTWINDRSNTSVKATINIIGIYHI